MRVVIAAGGTGGHIYPAIAVVEALQALTETQSLFIGSDRDLEEQIFKTEQVRHEALKVGRIKGESLMQRLKTFLLLPVMVWRSRKLLLDFGPDLVFGMGGYSSGPVFLAALWLRFPRVLLEPNAIPGFTNRILGWFVQRVFVAVRSTERFFPAKKVLFVGTPVRRQLTQLKPIRSANFTVLVLGGSQGAHSINQAMVNALPLLERSGRPVALIHQTGMADFRWAQEAYRHSLVPHEVHPFIKEMAQVYARADLVISRAGASTVAELLATGIPSILIPYPHAADDHQRFNALHLVETGGAEMILDRELSGETLAGRILHYETHRESLQEMRKGLERGEGKTAATRVAQECYALATQ